MTETTTAWQRSSYCASGACIEVARIDGTIRLRDSKNPDQPPVVFSPMEWADFQDRLLTSFGSS